MKNIESLHDGIQSFLKMVVDKSKKQRQQSPKLADKINCKRIQDDATKSIKLINKLFFELQAFDENKSFDLGTTTPVLAADKPA